MMRGSVRGKEALLLLEVVGPLGASVILPVLIDTGYTGVLLLPPHVIASLGLAMNGTRQVRLPDGRIANVDTFDVEMRWHDRLISVIASEIDSDPLLGMSLLHGSRLTIDVIDSGAVVIDELPSP